MAKRKKTSNIPELHRIALVGSYVPRQCGIATFTKDLHDAFVTVDSTADSLVVAMDDVPEGYAYPAEVHFQLRAAQKRDYATAAGVLNINNVDIVSVQHEFGIYGGPDGNHLLRLMSRLRMPIITTLHTMLTEPTPGQATVMENIAQRSDRLVVMSRKAFNILEDVYGVEREKIVFIPHGIPDVPFVDPAFYKDQFGLEGRTVLLTFGLLSPGKGIEVVIKALPHIVKEYPDVMYVILGATHPHILKQQGNAYRDSLERLAERLGVQEHVVFHNRYVSLDELCGYIGAADIYVTSYVNKAQITSGTLAYALGAGKAVVSTPFWYAEELLDEGRGRLFPFNDHDALAGTVRELLSNSLERNAMRKKAYTYGRDMVWSSVGRQYLDLAHEVLADWQRRPHAAPTLPAPVIDEGHIPDADLTHLRTLTDDTGILQHAIFDVPDRFHGYCTDDNARALIATLMYYDLYRDESVVPLAHAYLSFLYHAFNRETGRFRNFMSYDRRWLEDAGSDDCHGRAMWALGQATALAPNESIASFSMRLFSDALDAVESIYSSRAWAFALIGMHAYLRRFDGDTQVRRLRALLAQRLHEKFTGNMAPDWPWCEDILTYDNAKLPHALILCGQWIPDAEMTQQGLESLDWLYNLQVNDEGGISLIGNDGWMRRNGPRARFDQQAVDAMALVEACAEAFRCTQDATWRSRAHRCLEWFLGNNDTQSVIYNYQTGGCSDGLEPDGPNLNQGAESTIAWLVAVLTMHDLSRSAVVAERSKKLMAGKDTAVPTH